MLLPSLAPVVVGLSLLSTQISAAPVDIINGLDPSTWPTSYIKTKYVTQQPKQDACLFYTNGLKNEAIDYATKHRKTTVYDIYAPSTFSSSIYPFSWFFDRNRQRDWFKITSRAFAEVCTGYAILLIKDGQRVPYDAIWYTDEYKAIQEGTSAITKVYAVDPIKQTIATFDPTPGAAQSIKAPIRYHDETKRSVDSEELPGPQAETGPLEKRKIEGFMPDVIFPTITQVSVIVSATRLVTDAVKKTLPDFS